MGDPKKDVIDTAVKQSSFAREQHMLGELLDPRKPNPASEAEKKPRTPEELEQAQAKEAYDHEQSKQYGDFAKVRPDGKPEVAVRSSLTDTDRLMKAHAPRDANGKQQGEKEAEGTAYPAGAHADPDQHVRVQNYAWAVADARARKMGIKTMAHVEKGLKKNAELETLLSSG